MLSKFQERIEQEIELQSQRLSDARRKKRKGKDYEEYKWVSKPIEGEWLMNGIQIIQTHKEYYANALKEYLIDEGEWEGETKDEFRTAIAEPKG